ncbi:PREDICTED: repressed by EFG1 protein 1 isoform X2 [Tarenaya hassleriana]|uniref:repressed by EFG1 protein 1 isoform X3 n=1 Tax=Tarenaya hassleriana TaxID=28532 RepID=UPI00053C871A|nr:PREDICTED: repressed by EFG1 protein 1 isoform X3 [Tarenaya hassleriana]XP_019056510.1 PREDICTED: repressed by EFG1 protein 1 isoform X2 [Tarenaya hassleriana]
MELRISKTRHPIPLLLLFSFFFSQFFPATPQTLSIGFHYRSSTRSPPVSSPTTTIAKSPPVSSPTTTTAKSPPGSSPTTTTAKSPPVSSPTTTTAKSPPGSSPTTTTAKSPPGSSPTTTTAKSPPGSSPTTTTAKSPSTSSPTTTTAESPPVTPSQSTVVFNATRKRRPNRAKAEFLNAHNAVRRRVGEPLRLAAYAGAWAKKRVGDCRLVHSNGPFGENIFWGGNTKWRPRDVVRIWAEENKYYDEKANACEPDQMCGHYTQIVWRESTKVGCAREECSNGGVYVICVYNPPGNYEGENPFGQYTDKSGVDRNDPPATVAQPLV